MSSNVVELKITLTHIVLIYNTLYYINNLTYYITYYIALIIILITAS